MIEIIKSLIGKQRNKMHVITFLYVALITNQIYDVSK